MTFAMTSEVDDAHPSNAKKAELTSAYSAALNIGESCLADGPVGRVGLEVEAHCFDLADPMRRPEWAELKDAIAGVPAAARRQRDHRRTRRRGRVVRPADG